ncbi:hypothetical protein GCM10022243_61710 [Saccharothrix violaceirubra]|uniref:Uncharacterized protein n=1 Tax=Saccharothrix violaceirubra TaxID=413306 RepID=A0A7W7WYE7_9PSEU|nr:hypothetical protein [Saccharothrix violaceirubra]MBB4968147.1 hypothetical protein [Saccharothrix violaceirubra]
MDPAPRPHAGGTTTLTPAAPGRLRRGGTPHLVQAQRLVDYLSLPVCPPGNNVYKEPDQPNVVVWGSPDDAATWINRSQCASFQTAVLKRAHRWATSAFFTAHFGMASPFARDYRAVFAEDDVPRFRRVHRVADLRPGDLIAIDYRNEQDTNTGHIVMVRRTRGVYVAPVASLNFPGEVQYAVEIVDCTSEPHGQVGVGNYAAYPDSRLVGRRRGEGAGYGHMMFYADERTGMFTRYRWSVNTASAGAHPMDRRPIAAARVG